MVVENEQTTTVFYLSNKMNEWCESCTYKFTDGGDDWNVNREEIEHDANMEAENEEERANNSMIFFLFNVM